MLLGGIIKFLLPFGEFVSLILRKWVKMFETKTQLWLVKNTGCLIWRSRKVKFWLSMPFLEINIVPLTKFTELFIKRPSRNNSFYSKYYQTNFLQTPRYNIFNNLKFIAFYTPLRERLDSLPISREIVASRRFYFPLASLFLRRDFQYFSLDFIVILGRKLLST